MKRFLKKSLLGILFIASSFSTACNLQDFILIKDEEENVEEQEAKVSNPVPAYTGGSIIFDNDDNNEENENQQGSEQETETGPIERFELFEQQELNVGDEATLYFQIYPEEAYSNASNLEMSCTTNTPELIEILNLNKNNCTVRVRGLAEGEAKVTIQTPYGVKATWTIQITNIIRPNSIILESEELEMYEEETHELSYSFGPEGAIYDGDIIWYSQYPNIADVDQNGLITAKNYGETIITVSDVNGILQASCRVIVKPFAGFESSTGEKITFQKLVEDGYFNASKDHSSDGLVVSGANKTLLSTIENGVLYLPDTVTRIDFNAFHGFTNLRQIYLPDNLETISLMAFHDCPNLIQLDIPKSVKNIYGQGGDYNIYIQKYVVDPANENYYTPANSYAIYDKDTTILRYAANNSTIANNTTEILPAAFGSLRTISRVDIPDSVRILGLNAFNGCSVEEVTIGSGVAEFDGFYFANLFTSCNNLQRISVSPYNSVFDSRNNCNAVVRKADNTLVYAARQAQFLSSMTTWDTHVFFFNHDVTSVTIPSGVQTIKKMCFSSCRNLSSITIPTSVTRIEPSAFHNLAENFTIYYKGSQAEWNNIDTTDDFNNPTTYNNVVFNA